MGDNSAIEWTDATWNPIVGCSIVSKGCTNCYAMKVAGARTKHTAKYTGLTKPSKGGPVWTGEVRFWEKALLDPLKWKEPRRVFVNSMGDLFHESISDEWIDRCFAVMALAPQHTFQVLTKRPARMREYCCLRVGLERHRRIREIALALKPDAFDDRHLEWPLPNVWLGVSAEDQATADERIPILLDTPAAVRFISAEPLLGPIRLINIPIKTGPDNGPGDRGFSKRGVDWIIVGGESGHGARPMHPDWARSLRDQCQAAGVPFFFKQWGEWTAEVVAGTAIDLRTLPRNQCVAWGDGKTNHTRYTRVGKATAGRFLDGREWSEFPA